jgi:hypothetical protein
VLMCNASPLRKAFLLYSRVIPAASGVKYDD